MKTVIDISRCESGMTMIYVRGIASNRKRQELIAEAISIIQSDPENALTKEYMGMKNYAAFGDQRCDCYYGMGPTHGSIVFKIGRQRKFEGAIHSDAIYYLECERDFVPFKHKEEGEYFNLYETILELKNHVFAVEELEANLKKQEVDSVLLEIDDSNDKQLIPEE